MRIVKTAQGTKLVISRKEYDAIGKQLKEAGYLPVIRPNDFFTWLKRVGYSLDRQVGSHQTWVNKALPNGDPKKNVTVIHHGPEKEVRSDNLKEILQQLGVDLGVVHNTGDLPKNFVVQPTAGEPAAAPAPPPSRDWRDYQKRPPYSR